MHDNAHSNAPQDSSRFGLVPGLKGEQFRAEELGLHRHTLLRARSRGELAFVRIGDRIFYSDLHLTEWIARHEQPANVIQRGQAA